MDSSCIIGIQHVFGQIEYITIYWDGQGVEQILQEYYLKREDVIHMIRGGSRPFLDEPDVLLEEIGDSPKLVRTYQEFFNIKEHTPQYYYLFTTDNSWVSDVAYT